MYETVARMKSNSHGFHVPAKLNLSCSHLCGYFSHNVETDLGVKAQFSELRIIVVPEKQDSQISHERWQPNSRKMKNKTQTGITEVFG